MKSKIAKRLWAAALTLVMAVSLLSTSVLAEDTATGVKVKAGTDGKIVVTVYDQNPSGTAGTGAQAQEGILSGTPVNGVGINALKIGDVVELTTTDENNNVSTQVAFGLSDEICNQLGLVIDNAIANKSEVYYFEPTAVQTALGKADQAQIETYVKDAAEKKTEITGAEPNENGVATFSGLDYGLYLLAKSELPSDATTDLVPFLVSVPMYVNNAWSKEVYAYPKVRTGDVTIEKIVDDTDKYVNAGQTLKYTVTATIPAAATGNGDATPFTDFTITDTNTGSTLDIAQDNLIVELNGDKLQKDTQYKVSYTSGVLTITLTRTQNTGGLAALNKDLSNPQTITVTYDATVATNGTFSSELINTANATYQRDGMTDTANAIIATGGNNTVTLYTYGIDLTKTLSDTKDHIGNEEISFELYKDNSGNLGDKIPVKPDKAGYWVTANAAAPATDTYTMYVGENTGKLNIYGLEPGTYHLKETATMQGYTKLDKPITIVITGGNSETEAKATVDTVNAQVTDGVVYLSVVNTKNELGFKLPQTGGAGTLLATVIGLGLICAAVILLTIYRKKGRKNS